MTEEKEKEVRKLKYERFIDETITYGFTRYKEDLLCQFINENRIKDIQKIHINDYEIQLFYWEE